MKLKISFDVKAIGNFFLEHAEKVLLGLFILVFVTILYGAVMRREKFDKTPKDLSDKCSTAERSLEGERPELLKSLETTRDYNKDAQSIANPSDKKGISVDPYESDVVWDKPLFPMKGKRQQPTLIDVQDLRTAAEFGAFQISTVPAAETPTRTGREITPGRGGRGATGGRIVSGNTTVAGKRWVVITGLVPIEQQASAYRNAFRDAIGYDPEKDVPVYMGYYVERAEINSPADEKNPKWTKKFNSSDAEKEFTKDWAQSPQQIMDVVGQKYTDPVLTFPLGPLQNRVWGETVAHKPDIPLFNAEAAKTATPTPDAQPAEDATATGFGERDERAPAPRNASRQDQRRFQRPVDVRQNRGEVADAGPVKYKLLRFFDFSVEPGKSYIYRVQLVLKNPNQGIDASKLKEAKFAQDKYLFTAVSTQSNRIYVPTDTQFLVGVVKTKPEDLLPGKFPLVLLKWIKDSGKEGYFYLPAVERGQVINILNEKPTSVVVPDAPSGSDSESAKNTDFITDATVLDMDGGKRLIGKGKLTEPREMLFMVVNDKSITLMTRSELEDLAEVNRATEPEPPKAPAGGRGVPGARGGVGEGQRLLFGAPGDPRRPPGRP
jgi:hypothetical protein